MTLEIDPKHQLAILSHMAPRALTEVLLETTGARVRFPQAAALEGENLLTHLSPPSPPRSRTGFYAPRLCPQMEMPAVPLYQRPKTRSMITICGSVHSCFLARQNLMVGWDTLWLYGGSGFDYRPPNHSILFEAGALCVTRIRYCTWSVSSATPTWKSGRCRLIVCYFVWDILFLENSWVNIIIFIKYR